MKLTPRRILYIAVCNYISEQEAEDFFNELVQFKKINDEKFLRTLHKYFDIKRFRDQPFIPEDIWLFNYLMYQTHKKDSFNPLNFGEVVGFKGRLLRKGLIAKYERQIVLPQLEVLGSAHRILNSAVE